MASQLNRGVLSLLATGGALSAMSPDEAEAAGWKPWKPKQPMLPWMDQLWDVLEQRRFSEPFVNSEMLNPKVAESMAKAAYSDIVPENIRIPESQLLHIYNRRVLDNNMPIGDVVRMFGRTFGDPNAIAVPQGGKLKPVLTALDSTVNTSALFPYHLEDLDAILHSGMIKKPAAIRRIREDGTALLEGRSGPHNATDPSFSLDGNAAYDTQLLRLSDVSNADEKNIHNGLLKVNRHDMDIKKILPVGLLGMAALAPGQAQAAIPVKPHRYPADEPGWVNPEPPLGTPVFDLADVITGGVGIAGTGAKLLASALTPIVNYGADKITNGILSLFQDTPNRNGGGGI